MAEVARELDHRDSLDPVFARLIISGRLASREPSSTRINCNSTPGTRSTTSVTRRTSSAQRILFVVDGHNDRERLGAGPAVRSSYLGHRRAMLASR